MSGRRFSGFAQIFGLLGCLFFFGISFMWLTHPERHLDWTLRIVFVFLCLFLDALALRSLFEADESRLGRFFFRIGDSAMSLIKPIVGILATGKFKDKFKDLPLKEDGGEKTLGEKNRNDSI